jgi:hypothetical protein
MKATRASFRVWGLLTLSFAAGVCLTEYVADPRAGWVRSYWDWARFGFGAFGETVRSLIAVALTLFLGCALAAVAVQATFRRLGFRVWTDPEPTHAADYDDNPTAQ